MEQDIAILIADLSGYTALTETHGPYTAAELIDTYTRIVNESLVGSAHLHQRVGDEVVIVSTDPLHLLSTAVILLKKTNGEKNFLALHGGIHYGRILKRHDHYFGSTINMASRIASKATYGTFFCSSEIVEKLKGNSDFSFKPKGKFRFKNLDGENELFELVVDHLDTYHIDPVCRMMVHITGNAPSLSDNLFFCSTRCRDHYLKNYAST